MLKTNKTLIVLDLSDNEIGGFTTDKGYSYEKFNPTPEGPAALADGLKVNSVVQELDASKNAMGTAGAKACGDLLLMNKTIQTLDVSDNGFGKMQVGDEVKLKSSGEMIVVTRHSSSSGILHKGNTDAWTAHSEYEWESPVSAFCAGVAASPSLIVVSDF